MVQALKRVLHPQPERVTTACGGAVLAHVPVVQQCWGMWARVHPLGTRLVTLDWKHPCRANPTTYGSAAGVWGVKVKFDSTSVHSRALRWH